jgi:hypothetical protein
MLFKLNLIPSVSCPRIYIHQLLSPRLLTRTVKASFAY